MQQATVTTEGTQNKGLAVSKTTQSCYGKVLLELKENKIVFVLSIHQKLAVYQFNGKTNIQTHCRREYQPLGDQCDLLLI